MNDRPGRDPHRLPWYLWILVWFPLCLLVFAGTAGRLRSQDDVPWPEAIEGGLWGAGVVTIGFLFAAVLSYFLYRPASKRERRALCEPASANQEMPSSFSPLLVTDRRRRVVYSPDGREFHLEALPAGLTTMDVQHPLAWLLGWLWHFSAGRRRWRVEVRERTAQSPWAWRGPPWWSIGNLHEKEAAFEELDRLARHIEVGNWSDE